VVWLLFDPLGSIIVSTVYFLLCIWLYGKSVVIYENLNPKMVVSGRIKGNPVKNVGALMGDERLSGETGVTASFATNI